MANISTFGRTDYVLTQADITNGFASVPILWDSPFNDTNYNFVWEIIDTSFSTPSLDFAHGDSHSIKGNGFTAVVDISASVPLIEAVADLVNSTSTLTPLSLTSPETTLYQVTFYYGPADASGSGTWIPTVTWQDPSGNNLTMTYPYLGPATAGDVENYQSYSIPYFVKLGTPIAVTGAYSGAAFPMNIAIRVVRMPSNSDASIVGDQVSVYALASHR